MDDGNIEQATPRLPREAEIEEEATRETPWPKSIFRVASIEKPQFFRMATMFGLIAFIYSIMRDLKDVVVLDKQEATSINIIKGVMVTPFSFAFVFLIQKLLDNNSVARILKIMVLAFGVYFCLYSTVLLGVRNFVEPNVIWSDYFFADGKMEIRGMQFILAVFKTINFWTGSLLYISAELWGNIVLSLLFLNYSNEVCTPKQCNRFIPIFIIFSNIGLLSSGLFLYGFFHVYDTFDYSISKYVLNGIVFLMGIVCVVIFLIQSNLDNSILLKPVFVPEKGVSSKKKKQKVGFVEGILYMMKSVLLLNICFIVLAYNIVTNMIDSVFKSTMKAAAMANNLDVGGSVMKTQAFNQMLVAILVIIFLCTPFSRLVSLVSWSIVGFITPIFGIVGGLAIFGLAMYNTGSDNINMWTYVNDFLKGSTSKIDLELTIGRVVVAFMKVFKYSAFDIAKEAISVRINAEDRPRFKGIFDGLCGKLGKSTGSGIGILFAYFSNSTDIRRACQLCFVVTVLIGIIWIYSVKYLGGKYNESIARNTDIDLDMIGKKTL